MSDNIENIDIPAGEWVDLYLLSGIAIGTAVTIENVGVCDVYLAVQAIQPLVTHDSYNIIQRGNGVRLQNSPGDTGLWAFCNSDDAKLAVGLTTGTGSYPSIAAIIHNSDGSPVTTSDPLSVSDYDNSHRSAANTVFGDRIIGTRVPTIAAQFQYGLRADDTVVDFVSTGTVVVDDSMLKLRTGIAADGSIGVQGADYIRYIPGHEAYAFFTSVFAEPAEGLTQRIGVFDYDGGNGNGFFIGYNGLIFGVTRRRNGVDYFKPVDISTVFPPEIDPFNPQSGNVFKISYGYLGFATIHFEIMLPEGSFEALAEIQFPNTSDVTHIGNTNIPLRAEMTNSGNTVNSEMRIGSVSAGIVDGGGTDPIARVFTQEIPPTTLAINTTTQLIHFRNKSIFFGLTNKVSAQLLLLSASTQGNKPVSWAIKNNSDITTPGTWADVSVDSVMEYSLDTVVDINTGENSILWKMGREDSFFEDVERYLIKLRPNEWATIYAISQTASDVELSVRWKELF